MKADDYSVAMTTQLEEMLQKHLLHQEDQEDLAFALWNPSQGETRQTAMLFRAILPKEGERNLHGNTSFEMTYFQRVCTAAVEAGCGIAFLHSHPGPGWQDLSDDDHAAESRMAGATLALTGLPLVGMTIGSDGTWSARFWQRTGKKQYVPSWCANVRVVGERLKVHYDDAQVPPAEYQEMFKRTATTWGARNHQDLARLRVGIIGLGSVGSMVAESLARMGMQRIVLIDFDKVETHNLDRLLGASTEDIGQYKVDVIAREIASSSTAKKVVVTGVLQSVAREGGYRAALDCDVLFSCVDRPYPRSVLNHIAYAHLIPVVDGGIAVRFKKGRFSGVDWQVQTVGPDRPCLSCVGAFDWGFVQLDKQGKLDDPTYMNGLPDDHQAKRNENVFPFSMNVASLEIMQFVALATGVGNMPHVGIQRFRYYPGVVTCEQTACQGGCLSSDLIAQGDRNFSPL